MKFRGSLCLQKPTPLPHPKSDESSPHPHTGFSSYLSQYYYTPSYIQVFQVVSPLRFSNVNFVYVYMMVYPNVSRLS